VRPVFISYARLSAAREATALRDELGPDLAFLDSTDIAAGDLIPDSITGAILGASIVVIFLDDVYVTHPYCLREMRLALAAPQRIILALGRNADLGLVPLPPRNWLAASATHALADVVRAAVHAHPGSLRDDNHEATRSLAQLVVEDSALPPVAPIHVDIPQSRYVRPSIHDRFVGRGVDLARLHALLYSPLPGAVAITGAVVAAGGFGKTQLALEYFHRYGPRYYPGGLFWINAANDSDGFHDQHHHMLAELRSPDVVPSLAELRERKIDLRSELARALQLARGRVLVVVDNVPETEAGAELSRLDRFCPFIGGQVTVLLTSRQKRLDATIRSIEIETLSRSASSALLTFRLPNVNELRAHEWDEIAAWVGDLPLALDLLNRSLHLEMTPKQLLKRSRTGQAVVELDTRADLLRGYVSPGSVRGVTETFDISLAALTAPARRCLQVLAELECEPIPESFMEALPPELNSDGVRTDLHGRHLVTGRSHGVFGAMHRVLADYVRSSSDRSIPWLDAAKGFNVVGLGERCADATSWPELNQLKPHAVRLFRYAPETFHDARDVDAICAQLDIGYSLGVLLLSQGDYPGARSVQAAVLELSTRTLGHHHAETPRAMHNLSATLGLLGDDEQERQLLERAIPLLVETLGTKHPDTLITSLHYARSIWSIGCREEARHFTLNALETFRMTLGEEHPNTYRAWHQLAWMSENDARGPVHAINAAGGLIRTLGAKHLHSMAAMETLVSVMSRDYPASKKAAVHRVIAQMWCDVLGSEHPTTIAAHQRAEEIARENAPSSPQPTERRRAPATRQDSQIVASSIALWRRFFLAIRSSIVSFRNGRN
jgi:hypothetical protein